MTDLEQEQESYSKTTAEIVITVAPQFVAEKSDIAERIYSHAYTVTMRNQGQKAVQLINRHWIVESAGCQIADVKGEGVIGEQPVLKSGASYSYTSWTVVCDPVGAMYGSYTFYSEDGKFIDVEIPRFNLIYLDSTAVH